MSWLIIAALFTILTIAVRALSRSETLKRHIAAEEARTFDEVDLTEDELDAWAAIVARNDGRVQGGESA